MNRADQPIELPVHKSTSEDGNFTLTRIDSPSEMDDWGETVNGPISDNGMSIIENFFGVTPKVTSWCGIGRSIIPNSYEFSLPTASRGVKFVFRIWQKGVGGSSDKAEVDIYLHDNRRPQVFSFSSDVRKIVWVGIGHNQLLVATTDGVLYRATRLRSVKQGWRGLIWYFSKVMGFRIEVSSLRDRLNGFARYVPTHLR